MTTSPELFIAEARRHLMQEYLPWLRACLAKLSEEDVWWRPNEKSNSIGNLILHLCGNIRQWVIHGVDGTADERNRPAEFVAHESFSKIELLQKLESTLSEVDSVLANVHLEKLADQRVIQGFNVTVLGAIFHVVEHFSYHTGQIIYITKMRTGEDLKFWNI
ncbi:MAG: DinB family protein [bacterium]